MMEVIQELANDIFGMPNPQWFTDKWLNTFQEIFEKADKYDKIIDLTKTHYYDYAVENLPELILQISDGVNVQSSTETPT